MILKNIEFYKEVAGLVRRDIVKQKYLLPPENLAGLCAEHHRKHRDLFDKLQMLPCTTALTDKKIIFAIQKIYPDLGIEQAPFDFLQIAKNYTEKKAFALAVVTEKHFYGGTPSMLTGVAHMVDLPIIRWDFIIDSYQIMQSRLWGADAVRLIVPLLDQSELTTFTQLAEEHELEVIFEINSQDDLMRIDFSTRGTIFINPENMDFSELQSLAEKASRKFPVIINGDIVDDEKISDISCQAAVYFSKQLRTPLP